MSKSTHYNPVVFSSVTRRQFVNRLDKSYPHPFNGKPLYFNEEGKKLALELFDFWNSIDRIERNGLILIHDFRSNCFVIFGRNKRNGAELFFGQDINEEHGQYLIYKINEDGEIKNLSITKRLSEFKESQIVNAWNKVKW